MVSGKKLGFQRRLLTGACSLTLQPCGLWPAKLFCPWDSPGKNTGVGCHFLLQGILLTQGSNPRLLCLLLWQEDSSTTAPPGKSETEKRYGFR